MSRTVPEALGIHLNKGVTTIAVIWMMVRNDGVVIRGTDHDISIQILSGDWTGTYPASNAVSASDVRSGDDMSVDNMEVNAVMQDELVALAVNPLDIDNGLYDAARVAVALVNWANPENGILEIRVGPIGDIRPSSDRKVQTEIRGLAQYLSQQVGETYGITCTLRLGSEDCGVDLDALTITGSVTAVTSRYRFNTALIGGTGPGDYVGGLLTFTSGVNAGYSREVRQDDIDGIEGHLDFFEGWIEEPSIGDTFELQPGDDHTFETCRDRFDKAINHRGHGRLVPGIGTLLRGANV